MKLLKKWRRNNVLGSILGGNIGDDCFEYTFRLGYFMEKYEIDEMSEEDIEEYLNKMENRVFKLDDKLDAIRNEFKRSARAKERDCYKMRIIANDLRGDIDKITWHFVQFIENNEYFLKRLSKDNKKKSNIIKDNLITLLAYYCSFRYILDSDDIEEDD